jgi:hypothetical protein
MCYRFKIVDRLFAKKSSAFRGRSAARHLTAWLAVLVQLHIFLVLELHHHVLSPRLLRDAATAGSTWNKSNTLPLTRPLCPACQVARQGAVQPAVERLAWLPLRAVAAAPSNRTLSLTAIFLLQSSGRDPPRA